MYFDIHIILTSAFKVIVKKKNIYFLIILCLSQKLNLWKCERATQFNDKNKIIKHWNDDSYLLNLLTNNYI